MIESKENREARNWLNENFGINQDDSAECELHGGPAYTCPTCIALSQ